MFHPHAAHVEAQLAERARRRVGAIAVAAATVGRDSGAGWQARAHVRAERVDASLRLAARKVGVDK